jgi:hypothetical protein
MKEENLSAALVMQMFDFANPKARSKRAENVRKRENFSHFHYLEKQ